jgi:heme/copper-type cytochrome/quinol oxidase subunit 3
VTPVVPQTRPALAPADERRSLGYLGMVIFLGSWAMMFGALFFVYAGLRAKAPAWPPAGVTPLPLLLPGLSTVILLASSATLHLGLQRVRQGRAADFAPWLVSTLGIGAAFLALQVFIWVRLYESGLHPSSGTYGSIFYTFTAFHFLHVVVGLGLLGWLVPRALRRTLAARHQLRIKLMSMFWHFVTIVWVVIYASVYLL